MTHQAQAMTATMADLPTAANSPTPPLCVDAAQVPLAGGTDPTYGEVRWRTLINGSEQAPRDMVLGIAEFEAGHQLKPHCHAEAEWYLGLDGSGIVTLDGVEHEIRAGVALYVPGNAEHGTVAGPEGLRFAYGFSCTSFEQVTYHFTAQP